MRHKAKYGAVEIVRITCRALLSQPEPCISLNLAKMTETDLKTRVVPGAPPKEPLTKTQKRRRKPKTKGDGANNDDAAGSVAEATPAPPAPKVLEAEDAYLAPVAVEIEASSPIVETEPLLSPIVELVNKRLKATTKKMVGFFLFQRLLLALTSPDDPFPGPCHIIRLY